MGGLISFCFGCRVGSYSTWPTRLHLLTVSFLPSKPREDGISKACRLGGEGHNQPTQIQLPHCYACSDTLQVPTERVGVWRMLSQQVVQPTNHVEWEEEQNALKNEQQQAVNNSQLKDAIQAFQALGFTQHKPSIHSGPAL